MIKHSSSHGLSVLLCTIIAAFIEELISPYIPGLFSNFERVSLFLANYIPLCSDHITILLIATILGLVWGVFFKLRFVKD